MRNVALSCALLCLLIASCRPSKLPGQSVGEFQVTGTLDQNECGSGVAADSQISFRVELRHDANVGYWKLGDAPVMTGSVTATTFRFEQRQQVQAIPSDDATGNPGCALQQYDLVSGTLAAGADAGAGTAMAGMMSTRLSIGGGNCTPLLATQGGPFPMLACEVSYTLSGDRVASSTTH